LGPLHSNSIMAEFGTSNSAQQLLTSLFSHLFSATSVLCLLASIVFFLLLRGRSTRGAAAEKSRNLRQHDDELQQLSTWGQQLPPGSMGLPLIGETLYYSRSMKTSKPTFMADHRKKFGDIFKTKLMGTFCIIMTKPDFIKWVLAHDGKEIITGYPKSFKNVIGGDSTLNSVGARWKSARKFLVNSLRTERLRTRVSVVEDLILECLDSWQNKDPVNVREETKSLAFNAIAQILLGSRLQSGPINDALRKDFFLMSEGLFAIPIKLPGTKFSNALQARARIIEKLERDVVSKPQPENDEDYYADYMEHMRQESLPGTTEEKLLEETRCHMLGTMLAGHETAACTMLFAVKYISEHPNVLAELRAEHEGIIRACKIGGGESRLNWDDYRKMHFTQHVISETLRLCNPISLAWRQAVEDISFHGYVVPKGWKVVCALREVHHDPAYYENPEQFNPWRHDNVDNTSASQYNCTYDYSCRTSLMKWIWKEIQDVG
jgi:steroid 22-alpha-hydroxylase